MRSHFRRRGQRGGAMENPSVARKRATDAVGGDHEVFDQLGCALCCASAQVDERVVFEHRARLDSRPGRARRLVTAAPASSRAARSCCLRFSARPGTALDLRRHRSFAFEPRADAVVRQLRAGCAPPRDTRRRSDRAVGRDDHYIDHEGVAIFVLVERCQIGRELLGQHRKDCAPRCRPRSCCGARDRRSA